MKIFTAGILAVVGWYALARTSSGGLVEFGYFLGWMSAALFVGALGLRRVGNLLIALDDAIGTAEPPRRGQRDVMDDWAREGRR